MQLHLKCGARREVIDVGGANDAIEVLPDGSAGFEARLVDRGTDALTLEIDGRRHRVRFWRDGSVLYLHLRGEVVRLDLEDPDEETGPAAGVASPVLRAPMPGKVLEVLVAEGDPVAAGTPLVRLEAMKMEIDLPAPGDGTVESIAVRAGDLVEPEAELLRLDPATGD